MWYCFKHPMLVLEILFHFSKNRSKWFAPNQVLMNFSNILNKYSMALNFADWPFLAGLPEQSPIPIEN